MKRIVISSREEAETKRKVTFSQKLAFGWIVINLLLSFALAIYSIVTKWGNGTLALVWLALLSVYVLIFVFVVMVSRKKSSDVFHNRLHYSLAALKILTGVSNLVNLLMALFQLISAFLKGDISGVTTIASVVVLLLFTILGLILKIDGIQKRRIKHRQRQAKLAEKQKKLEQKQEKQAAKQEKRNKKR